MPLMRVSNFMSWSGSARRLTPTCSHRPGHSEPDLVQLVPRLCRPCQVLYRSVCRLPAELGDLQRRDVFPGPQHLWHPPLGQRWKGVEAGRVLSRKCARKGVDCRHGQFSLSARGNSRENVTDTDQVVEYLTYQLLTQYGNNTEIKTALDKYDFYIIPFVNPDGFVYTQTNNRLWRKNRQTRSGVSCVGTDMNRNWPYKWDVAGGASTNPCDETYKGAAGGDTPENKALIAFSKTLTNGKGIKLFIDWHSYGHYILIPYGYNCAAKATNHARQLSLAQGLSTRIAQSYGTKFTTGQACAALYATVSFVRQGRRRTKSANGINRPETRPTISLMSARPSLHGPLSCVRDRRRPTALCSRLRRSCHRRSSSGRASSTCSRMFSL